MRFQSLIIAFILAAAAHISASASGEGSSGLSPAATLLSSEPGPQPASDFDHQRFAAEVTKRKDLPNFHEVQPFLYRSGQPTRQGMLVVKARGISTIIDLRAPSERKYDEGSLAKQMGIKYINLVMSSKAPTKAQVATFMDTVKDAQQHPDKGAVLVHCAHGSDRTGCMIGIWRVTQEGWPFDKAYAEMRKYWFTPKFTKLADAVRERARAKP